MPPRRLQLTREDGSPFRSNCRAIPHLQPSCIGGVSLGPSVVSNGSKSVAGLSRILMQGAQVPESPLAIQIRLVRCGSRRPCLTASCQRASCPLFDAVSDAVLAMSFARSRSNLAANLSTALLSLSPLYRLPSSIARSASTISPSSEVRLRCFIISLACTKGWPPSTKALVTIRRIA